MKVFFFQRPLHRKRQRETVELCPQGIEALTPQGITFTQDTQIIKQTSTPISRLKAWLLRLLIPLHVRPIRDPQVSETDFIYTWGCFPMDLRQPFVVELDTPYVLTLYSLPWFRLMRPILRRLLLRPQCRGIVCISDACRRGLRSELGEQVAAKACVVYPYMRDFTERPRRSSDDCVRFLFVSTQFYLKGGRETLHAFEKLVSRFPDAHLTVVSHPPPEILERYGQADWVRFVEADLEKERLYAEFYDRADVFVLPTYQDSFGLVFLEAIAFGLPVIATHLYAIPEIVKSGYNGYLLLPPLSCYAEDGRAIAANWKMDLSLRVLEESYPELEDELLKALEQMMDPEIRNAMTQASKAHFRTHFHPDRRSQAFLAALQNVGQR